MLESAKKHPGRQRREDFTLSQTVLFVSCYIIRAQIQDQTPLRTDRFQILHLLKTLRKIEEKLEKTCRFRLLICENLNCLPFVLYIIKHLMIQSACRLEHRMPSICTFMTVYSHHFETIKQKGNLRYLRVTTKSLIGSLSSSPRTEITLTS